MRYLEDHWRDVERDLNVVPFMTQALGNEDVKATVDATVEAFFKDKAKVLGPFDGADEKGQPKLRVFGNNYAGTKKARVRISYKDPDNPRLVKYRFEEKPATPAHILTATYRTRDEFGNTETEAGAPVEPWVHLVFEDGSQMDLAAIPVKAKKTKAAEAGAAS